MSVTRSKNWVAGQRVDVPHLREVDSSVAGDFDVLAGHILAGNVSLIVNGFRILTTGLVGQPATTIQVVTAGSGLIHPLATSSGSIHKVPEDRDTEVLSTTNARVTGSFTTSAVNYIGIDLVRVADDDTSDTVQFIDEATRQEVPKRVPLAKTMDYKIHVSTQDFTSTPGLAPLAIVTTDASNNVVTVQDARDLFFRLGDGGTLPDGLATYVWPDRTEAADNFESGDKSLASFKEWVDAVLTRIWELGGGEYWYSPTADRNVRMIRTGSAIVSSGDWFAWDGTNVSWQGLKVIFDNSTGYYNEIKDQIATSAGLTDLADGECIYVDLDRTQNLSGGSALQPVKAVMSTLGTPSVPGSRFVFLWRIGSEVFSRDGQWKVNAALPPATTSAIGAVKLNQTPGSSSAPVVPAIDTNGLISVTATVVGSTSYYAVNGVGANSGANTSSSGVKGTGGTSSSGGSFHGGNGIEGVGGASDFGNAGIGVKGTGGAATNAAGAAARGGSFTGGNGTGAGAAGVGVYATGGTTGAAGAQGAGVQAVGANNAGGAGDAGTGVIATGGTNTTGSAGSGVEATGGSVSNAAGTAGVGGIFVGGDSTGAGTGAAGVTTVGGTSGAAGGSGNGLEATGGSNTSGAAGNGLAGTGGATTSGDAGAGLVAQGGAATTGTPGTGAAVTGGNASSGNTDGGTGATITSGNGNGTGHAGSGLVVYSGSGKTSPGVAIVKSTHDSTTDYANSQGEQLSLQKSVSAGGKDQVDASLVVYDYGSNKLFHIPQFGAPSSRYASFKESWTQGSTSEVEAMSWTKSVDTGGGVGTYSLNGPSYASSYRGNYVTLSSQGSSSTAHARLETTRAMFPLPTITGQTGYVSYLSAEMIVGVANTEANSDLNLWVGFSTDPSDPTGSGNGTIAFRYLEGTDTGTNWYAYTKAAGGTGGSYETATTTGKSITNTAIPSKTLKIELYGANTERSGGSGTAVFWVDGDVVLVTTSTMPTNAPVKFFVSSASDPIPLPLFSTDLHVGEISIHWVVQGPTR